jgi:hypothetical protein
MKTALIITLGAREVQLSFDNLSDETKTEIGQVFQYNERLYTLSNPRTQGKFLLNNYENYKENIHFPIIEPAIKHVLNGNPTIDKVFLFSTDQKSAREKFKKKDTVYFAQILEKFISSKYKTKIRSINHTKITKNVTYYDEMYDLITQKTKEKAFRFNTSEYKVYLIAQGGIDAINTALLLKSIELFPDFNQLHKPENQDYVEILSFPDKFRLNFNKQLISNAVTNYNYSLILDNFSEINPNITQICNYAHCRLSLDYVGAFASCESMRKQNNFESAFIRHVLEKDIGLIEDNKRNKQTDLYLSAKIKLKQRHYGDYLMKIFTLSENILKPIVMDLGYDITFEENTEPKHKKWTNSFKLVDEKNNNEISKSLQNSKLKYGGLKFDSPNKYAFWGITEYFAQKNKYHKHILELCKLIFTLADLRNKVAHHLESVTLEMINTELRNKHNIDILDFSQQMDAFFSLESETDFGIYDQINKKIISLL